MLQILLTWCFCHQNSIGGAVALSCWHTCSTTFQSHQPSLPNVETTYVFADCVEITSRLRLFHIRYLQYVLHDTLMYILGFLTCHVLVAEKELADMTSLIGQLKQRATELERSLLAGTFSSSMEFGRVLSAADARLHRMTLISDNACNCQLQKIVRSLTFRVIKT